jgi:hypothetical protein
VQVVRLHPKLTHVLQWYSKFFYLEALVM